MDGAPDGVRGGKKSPSVRGGVGTLRGGWPWAKKPAPGAARAPPQEVLSPEVPRDRGPGSPAH